MLHTEIISTPECVLFWKSEECWGMHWTDREQEVLGSWLMCIACRWGMLITRRIPGRMLRWVPFAACICLLLLLFSGFCLKFLACSSLHFPVGAQTSYRGKTAWRIVVLRVSFLRLLGAFSRAHANILYVFMYNGTSPSRWDCRLGCGFTKAQSLQIWSTYSQGLAKVTVC